MLSTLWLLVGVGVVPEVWAVEGEALADSKQVRDYLLQQVLLTQSLLERVVRVEVVEAPLKEPMAQIPFFLVLHQPVVVVVGRLLLFLVPQVLTVDLVVLVVVGATATQEQDRV